MSRTPLYPAKTIAGILNLTERRVQQLAAEGVIPKADRGKYDLVGCVRGYIKYLQERAYGQEAVSSGDIHQHRARLAKENADKIEMENAQVRGRLFDVEEGVNAVGLLFSHVKQRLLSIPSKVAPEVKACKTLPQVRKAIQDAINDALRELAEADPAVYLGGTDAAVLNSAPRPDSEPVGRHASEAKS